jgi:alkylation response protein AidB-like acyl-CoA dehydrogenase
MSAAEDRAENIRLIRDSAAAVAPRGGDFLRIRALRFSEPGFDSGVWREICAMGWTGLRVPAEAGGAGLGMQEYCALAEELGAGLVPEPLIPCALAGSALQGDALAALLGGEKIVIPAWQERTNALHPGDQTTFDGKQLNGRKLFVHMAAGADAFLVVARGGLALVARDAPGVTLDIARTQDGGHFGTLTMVNAPAAPLPGRLAPAALDEAALATSAYLLGVMQRAFAMALDYLKTRRQFGRLIGSFQALQHRAADLKIQLELTRASVQTAVITLDTASAGAAEKQAAVSRAKARASEAALLLTRQAIQLHGGIGYTDEYDVGLFLRKAMVLANLYGSPALHRARWAALAPEDEEGE